MELTFDDAIEILELTDVSRLTESDLPQIARRARSRWHPDKVAHLNNPKITAEYTEKFKQVETACDLIRAFLNGSYHAGERFRQSSRSNHRAPEDVIRDNAAGIQSALLGLWTTIKNKKYKWSERDVVLSDGFRLRELLQEDFREDLAALSIISFFYGAVALGLGAMVAGAISPVLGFVAGALWFAQAASCFVGMMPLSRFWLPVEVQEWMIRFINVGLRVYHWAEQTGQGATTPWAILLIRIPVLFAKFVKYLILFPSYEIAKAVVGDRVVGVVTKSVNYYADAAEWYIDELLHKSADAMTSEELLHLSYLYSELGSAPRE